MDFFSIGFFSIAYAALKIDEFWYLKKSEFSIFVCAFCKNLVVRSEEKSENFPNDFENLFQNIFLSFCFQIFL